MTITIQQVQEIDDTLRQAMHLYLSQNKISRQFPLDQQRIDRMLVNMTSHPDYGLWVAYHNGLPVGFVSGRLEWSLFHDRIFAFDLGWFVLPGYQGRGIGRQLLDTYTEWAKGKGASVVHVSVVFGDQASDQASAEKLEDMGFELWGQLTRKVLE